MKQKTDAATQADKHYAALATEMMENIRDKYDLINVASIPAFVDNLATERESSARRAHAAETIIKDIRAMLSLQGDESILEAVAGLRREWQHAVNICTDTLSALGLEDLTNMNVLPKRAAELSDSIVHLTRRLSDLEAVRDMLDLTGMESVVDAVEKLKRERQLTTDICNEALGIVGSPFSIANLPTATNEIMAENQQLRHRVSDLEKIVDGENFTADIDAHVPPEYASLHRVLLAALNQAANGKGKERHAKAGEPFEQQKICEITRRVGLGYPLGQAIKKAEESTGLSIEAGIRENLGAINYLAAAVIVMEEQRQ